MRLNNGTSDPVDYEQSGGGEPLPDEVAETQGAGGEDQTGTLSPHTDSGDFIPSGLPPYSVYFHKSGQRSPNATSCAFSDPDATVTLNAEWTVTVSSGCD